jgi:hypothetical protein
MEYSSEAETKVRSAVTDAYSTVRYRAVISSHLISLPLRTLKISHQAFKPHSVRPSACPRASSEEGDVPVDSDRVLY